MSNCFKWLSCLLSLFRFSVHLQKLKLTKNLGKISGLIIGILVATTAVAAAVGIVSALSFDLQAIQVDQGSTELSRGAGASAEIRGYDSENAAAADC